LRVQIPFTTISGGPADALVARSGVLRNALAEPPVFFWYFDQIDDDIIRTSIQPVLKIIGDTFVESLLELDRAPGIQRDLNEDDIFATVSARATGQSVGQ